MWNPKTELVKHAAALAKEKHPEGFNKAQLVQASKEVFGGYAIGHKTVRTMEDVNNLGNAMAKIDGGYPVGMSTCMVVGINGGCGDTCPAFLSGACEEPPTAAEIRESEDLDEQDKSDLIETYWE